MGLRRWLGRERQTKKYRLWQTARHTNVRVGSLIFRYDPINIDGYVEGEEAQRLYTLEEGDPLPESPPPHTYLLTEKSPTTVSRLHGQRVETYAVLTVW